MKTGDIRKLLINYYGGKKECIAVLLEETDTKYWFFSMDGTQFEVKKSLVLSEGTVRSIPTETRSLLKDYAKLYQKLRAEQEKYEKIRKPLVDAMSKINTKTLRESRGLLTREEFVSVFSKSLPAYLQREMEKFELLMYSEDHLSIEHTEDIEKYFRKGSFVYEEYDGTIQMCSDAKNDLNYKKYLKRYTKTLPVKQKSISYLGIGDKDWLYCTTEYRVELKKPLTKKYAEEVAKLFSK